MPLPVVPEHPAVASERKDGPREDKHERRLRKQEAKRLYELERHPDAWERYRILVDVVVEARHLIELADHKARFALVIMGTVNMVLIVVGTRSEVIGLLPGRLQAWLAVALVPYAFLAFGFMIYAVETLRPRMLWSRRPRIPPAGGGPPPALGILFWEDIARWEPEELRRTWSEIRMSRILSEVIELARGSALICRAKYRALHRLYLCLHAMVVCAALLLASAVWVVLTAAHPY